MKNQHYFILIFAIVCLLALLAASGCSVAEHQCKQWRMDGLMYSSIESCTSCYQQYPMPQLEIVAGCALGLDAAQLIQSQSEAARR